jgi:IS1 family transposase
MPVNFTTSWSLFPPATTEVQADEKWGFVGKKQDHCNPMNPADEQKGDNWDHVAIDSVHRLVLCVIPGKRTDDKIFELIEDVHRRTGGRFMNLITTDEYKIYETAILRSYGEVIIPSPHVGSGRQKLPYLVVPPELKYAVVHKTRGEGGRVVKIEPKIIFGTYEQIRQALIESPVSKTINTAFQERQNGTDRNRNARKVRKTYCFSKDWHVHNSVTYFTMYTYNFCWPVRTLQIKAEDRHLITQTPAMSAGLTDHIWSLEEWLKFPVCKH